MPSLPQTLYSPEEYLALERKAEYKSEYFNGQILAMSGASREHNLISGNIFGEIHSQLRGKPCEVYIGDMRVKVNPAGMYTYPNVVAVCEEGRFEDEQVDTLTNPTVVVEVLSPSTEAYDRGVKFAHYRKLASLQEYVLVAQDKVSIEHFARHSGPVGQWVLTEMDDLDGTLHLASIGCDLALRDIYDRVEFPSEQNM
ncbi:MAG TPA: Uma2 family endonuclease [Chloroflexia bacterium]|jgi:Uma2 family endonuclease